MPPVSNPPQPGASASDVMAAVLDDPVALKVFDAISVTAGAVFISDVEDLLAIRESVFLAIRAATEARTSRGLGPVAGIEFAGPEGFLVEPGRPNLNDAVQPALMPGQVPSLQRGLRAIVSLAETQPRRPPCHWCVILATGIEPQLDHPGERAFLEHLLAFNLLASPRGLRETEDVGHRLLVIASYRDRPPASLAPYMTTIRARTPNPEAIRQLLSSGPVTGLAEPMADRVRRVVSESFGRGLTGRQILDVGMFALRAQLRTSAAPSAGDDPDQPTAYLDTFEAQKAERMGDVPGLRYTPASALLDAGALAGYRTVREELQLLGPGLAADADWRWLDKPTGFALIGLPGSGKTTMAQLIARDLEAMTGLPHPLLSVNFAEMRSKGYGDTEQAARRALERARSLGRAVILLDELEKLFGGDRSHEVTMATLSFVLQFLDRLRTDYESHVFVVATMNTAGDLPPELFRAGRFDGRFYTTIPAAASRSAILKLHLERRLVPSGPAGLLVETLAEDDHYGLVGAELAAAVSRAIFAAERREKGAVPTLDELREALRAARRGSVLRQHGDRLQAIADDLRGRFTPVDPDEEPDIAGAISHLRTLDTAESAPPTRGRSGSGRRRSLGTD